MHGIAEPCSPAEALLFKIEGNGADMGTETVTNIPASWVMPSRIEKFQAEGTSTCPLSLSVLVDKEKFQV